MSYIIQQREQYSSGIFVYRCVCVCMSERDHESGGSAVDLLYYAQTYTHAQRAHQTKRNGMNKEKLQYISTLMHTGKQAGWQASKHTQHSTHTGTESHLVYCIVVVVIVFSRGFAVCCFCLSSTHKNRLLGCLFAIQQLLSSSPLLCNTLYDFE